MTIPPHTLDMIRQPAFLYDARGRIVAANDLAEALAGRPLLGSSCAEVVGIFGHHHPDGTPLAPEEMPGCRALAGREAIEVPFAVTVADGRTLEILATAAPTRDGDAVTGALVLWQDVTDRKRAEDARRASEERLRLAQQSAEIGIWDRDVATDRVTITPGFLRRYGLEAGAVGSYGDWVRLIHPDDRERFEAERRAALDGEEPLNLDFRVILPSGELRWIQFRGKGVTDAAGSLVRVIGVLIDVTDRRLAEEALRRREQLLELALEAGGAAMWIREPGGGWITTPQINLLFGRPADATPLREEEFPGFIHPDDLPAVREAWYAAREVGSSYFKEYRVIWPDGSVHWLGSRGRVVADTDARPRFIGITYDITGRKEAEKALLEFAERLRERDLRLNLALDVASVGTFDWNIATGEETWDDRARMQWGLPPGSPVDHGVFEAGVHPDDLPAVEEAIRRALDPAGNGLFAAEYRVIGLCDGAERWITSRAQAFFEGVRPVRMIGTTIEITERKWAEAALAESEEQYRRLFESMSEPCIIAEPVLNDEGIPVDYRVVNSNPANVAYTGFLRDCAAGRTATELATVVDPFWFGLIADVACSGEPRSGEHQSAVFSRWYAYSAYSPAPGRCAVQYHDITDQKLAAQRIARFTDDLRRSNEELQRFAYVASHDLQEPLRSIVSFSQLLERRYKGKLDQDADDYIQFIVEGGVRMQTLIRDLLQLSRIETKAQPPVTVDSGEVVADALRALETPIREAGATVEVGALPTVMADPAQLEQVFANLIGNALKYRRPTVPLEIRISAERQDGMVEFSVADNGIGVEAEYYDRIFEMFRRLHTREQYDGTGIGLAVVKRIVDRHGGRVWVESTPGEGSTFFFTLPAA